MNGKRWIMKEKLYSIYFWWGTPAELGLKRILDFVEFIKTKFDLSDLVEFSFELNPAPLEQTLEFIKTLPRYIQKCRFSIWIQSLDNNILEKSWRDYNFELVEILLNHLSSHEIYLNLDFISFWLETDRYFEKFNEFVSRYQKLVDSYSIYTLELFSGSVWLNEYKTDEDKILDNFKKYIQIIQKYWYKRYEISNFAKFWKESKHNCVYWEMKPYLGLWVSASSLLIYWKVKNWKLKNSRWFMRLTNSYWIQDFLKWEFKYKEYKELSEKEILEEKVFLGLRTTKGIVIDDDIKNILNWGKIEEFIQAEYLLLTSSFNRDILKMTEKWFDIYNYLITEILL